MRRLMFRSVAIFLAIVGLISLLFPLIALVNPGGSMLLDTHAYLGAGTAGSVPSVSAVNCWPQEFGTSIRNRRARLWDCKLTLGPGSSVAPTAMPIDPHEGKTGAQASAAFQRRLSSLAIPDIRVQSIPSMLERKLPFDRSGQLPTLRRMSVIGEPLKYGVIWSGRELASRWFIFGCMSLLSFAFGGAAIYGARVAWHRR